MKRNNARNRSRIPASKTREVFAPPEIWTMIFREAGHPVSVDLPINFEDTFVQDYPDVSSIGITPPSTKEAYQTLLAISSTCRSWASLCIPLLYNYVWVSSQNQFNKLLPQLRRHPISQTLGHNTFGGAVRGLYIGYLSPTCTMLSAVCQVCPHLVLLRSVSLEGKNISQWRSLQANLCRLESLRCLDLGAAVFQRVSAPLDSAKPIVFRRLECLNCWSYIWRSISVWYTPNIRIMSVQFLAPDATDFQKCVLPFFRLNGRHIKRLTVVSGATQAEGRLIASDGQPIMSLCHDLEFMITTLAPVIPVLWESALPLSHPTLLGLIISMPWIPHDTPSRLKPILQSLNRRNFPCLRRVELSGAWPVDLKSDLYAKVSAPAWFADVLRSCEDDEIAVTQANTIMTVKVVEQFCVFEQDDG
ncbi:hypothetical protein SISNIDRAFT_549583 [Sistotremastrum niveocremeum HHB9708]|uniref:F-box domain-containing protein n=1 Tax=Sistotremastrum niveocremeum HHB9708 TaxID=1314777 RepID=A0A164V5R6_9AGAM|nr:hypothetical protein SISNIDRAFT_549583 [Sistotremastrum niveocremeum HHB9708]